MRTTSLRRLAALCAALTCVYPAPLMPGIAPSQTPSIQIQATAKSAPAATATATTNNTAQLLPGSSQPPCVPGNNVGSFFITTPNISSFLFAGDAINITFSFSNAVTILPNIVQVKYASVVDTNTWTQTNASISQEVLIKQQQAINSSDSSSFWIPWTLPQSMSDGFYVVRLVPDGKEIGNGVLTPPCFANGMVEPTTSAKFMVLQPVSLVASPDRFGPLPVTSGATRSACAAKLRQSRCTTVRSCMAQLFKTIGRSSSVAIAISITLYFLA